MDSIKKIKLKHALIPVAAFAVTVGTASAFSGSDFIKHLDLELSDEQLKALEQVQEIREGAQEEAKAILEAAGLDQEKMRTVYGAMRGAHTAQHAAMKTAIENDDYVAFLAAVEGTRVGDVVDTQTEFDKLVTAHELIKDGDRQAAKEIINDLGFKGLGHGMSGGMHRDHRSGYDGGWGIEGWSHR